MHTIPENAKVPLMYFGAFIAHYLVFKGIYKVLKAFKTFYFGSFFGLATDVKKLGKWAVVTGATDGIGKAYATELARKGLNVCLISRSEEKLSETAQELKQKSSVDVHTIKFDFNNDPSHYKGVGDALANMDIGVLVNNVGMSYPHPEFFAAIHSKQLIRSLISVNVTSVVEMTHLVLPGMVERQRGAIINISSGSGAVPTPLLTEYSAAKAFVDFFSRGLNSEYKAKGIIIQSVMPFFVTSKLSRIRRASLLVPNPATYVRSALGCLGLQDRTYGYILHEIQGWLISLLPESFYTWYSFVILNQSRKKALARNAAKTE